MLKSIAIWIERPLIRICLGLLAIVATVQFGPMSVMLMVTYLDNPWLFTIGLGAFLGLIGWWCRLFIGYTTLVNQTLLRWMVAGFLFIGISTILCAIPIYPFSDNLWFIMAGTMATAGALLFLGSLAAFRKRPNNSFNSAPQSDAQTGRLRRPAP